MAKAIYRLRDKLGEDTATPKWLHTLRGQGYRFTPPDAPTQAHHPSEPLTPMFGREDACEVVRDWLASSRPLLTVVGPGGIGKTRLALWAAAQVNGSGRLLGFCDLTGVQTAAAMWEQLAAALSIRLPIGSPLDAIRQRLDGPEGVFIVDNAEGVVDDLVAVISALPSGVKALVTSRQRLRLPSEELLWLPPLAPAAARALLVARSGWQDGEALAELVERLDRIPLALELIAARGPLLPLRVAVARAGAFINQLPDSTRPAHHQTMNAAIRWSWQRLSAEEQDALVGLAACGGAVSLDAAEAVGASPDAIGVVLALVERSLLRWDGEQITMFVTVRDFALSQASDLARPRKLLGQHLVAVGLRLRETGPVNSVRGAILRLAAMPALQTAWQAAVAARDGGLASGLAYLIAETRHTKMDPSHITADLITSLALPDQIPENAARAHYVLGTNATAAGQFALGQEHFQAVLDYCATADEPLFYATVCCSIANLHCPDQDRLALAQRAVEASRETHIYPAARVVQGFVLSADILYEEARICFDDGARLFAAQRDAEGVAWAIGGMARTAHDQSAAEAVVARLHDLEPSLPGNPGRWSHIGSLYHRLGRLDAAVHWLRKALVGLEQNGARVDAMIARSNLGVALVEQGNTDEGLFLLRDAYREASQRRHHYRWSMNGSLSQSLLIAGERTGALAINQELSPQWDWQWMWRSQALTACGHHEQARQAFDNMKLEWLKALVQGDDETVRRLSSDIGCHVRMARMVRERYPFGGASPAQSERSDSP